MLMKKTINAKSIKLHVTGSSLPAIVDYDSAEKYGLSELSWILSSTGHVRANRPRPERSGNTLSIQLSRIVLGLDDSEESDVRPVRHINKNRLDCRKQNLLACSWQQIAATQKILRKNNTSGYRGVSLHKSSGKWVATVRPNNKHISLGYYDNPLDAAKAYDMGAIKYFGENASINGVLTEADMNAA